MHFGTMRTHHRQDARWAKAYCGNLWFLTGVEPRRTYTTNISGVEVTPIKTMQLMCKKLLIPENAPFLAPILAAYIMLGSLLEC